MCAFWYCQTCYNVVHLVTQKYTYSAPLKKVNCVTYNRNTKSDRIIINVLWNSSLWVNMTKKVYRMRQIQNIVKTVTNFWFLYICTIETALSQKHD